MGDDAAMEANVHAACFCRVPDAWFRLTLAKIQDMVKAPQMSASCTLKSFIAFQIKFLKNVVTQHGKEAMYVHPLTFFCGTFQGNEHENKATSTKQ